MVIMSDTVVRLYILWFQQQISYILAKIGSYNECIHWHLFTSVFFWTFIWTFTEFDVKMAAILEMPTELPSRVMKIYFLSFLDSCKICLIIRLWEGRFGYFWYRWNLRMNLEITWIFDLPNLIEQILFRKMCEKN